MFRRNRYDLLLWALALISWRRSVVGVFGASWVTTQSSQENAAFWSNNQLKVHSVFQLHLTVFVCGWSSPVCPGSKHFDNTADEDKARLDDSDTELFPRLVNELSGSSMLYVLFLKVKLKQWTERPPITWEVQCLKPCDRRKESTRPAAVPLTLSNPSARINVGKVRSCNLPTKCLDVAVTFAYSLVSFRHRKHSFGFGKNHVLA